jgi:hypothetical protein
MVVLSRSGAWILEMDLCLPFAAGVILELVVESIDTSDKSERCRQNFAGLADDCDNFLILLLGDLVTLCKGANNPCLALHSKYLKLFLKSDHFCQYSNQLIFTSFLQRFRHFCPQRCPVPLQPIHQLQNRLVPYISKFLSWSLSFDWTQ